MGAPVLNRDGSCAAPAVVDVLQRAMERRKQRLRDKPAPHPSDHRRSTDHAAQVMLRRFRFSPGFWRG